MKTWIKIAALISVALCCLSGCRFLWWGDEDETQQVVIMYSAGRNSLYSYLRDDINTLKRSKLPGSRSKDVLVLVSHGYYGPASIVRMYEKGGRNCMDTLKVLGTDDYLTQKEVMREALTFVKDKFPSDKYGMVFSSHATGWLPEFYFSSSNDNVIQLGPGRRSIGQEEGSVGGRMVSYELSLADFVDALPMKMEYILFDACLMGTVECAYGLRNVCDYVGFSPTEVLSTGFDYESLLDDLFNHRPKAAVEAVCRHYFAKYEDKTTEYERSATIAAVDCAALGSLADVCRTPFSKYAQAIAGLDPSGIQRYYRFNKHWFYDLKDILVHAGITAAEEAQLDAALGGCVYYKAATDNFMYPLGYDPQTNPYTGPQDDWFAINTYCGLSSYLPCDGSETLSEYYKGLDWNKATGLVK